MTQCEKIVRHLKTYGSITSLDAMKEYGIMRLASRICNLKAQGYEIERKMVTSKNRFGESVTFAEYMLKGNKNENN